jgi:hypothetical protein
VNEEYSNRGYFDVCVIIFFNAFLIDGTMVTYLFLINYFKKSLSSLFKHVFKPLSFRSIARSSVLAALHDLHHALCLELLEKLRTCQRHRHGGGGSGSSGGGGGGADQNTSATVAAAAVGNGGAAAVGSEGGVAVDVWVHTNELKRIVESDQSGGKGSSSSSSSGDSIQGLLWKYDRSLDR